MTTALTARITPLVAAGDVLHLEPNRMDTLSTILVALFLAGVLIALIVGTIMFFAEIHGDTVGWRMTLLVGGVSVCVIGCMAAFVVYAILAPRADRPQADSLQAGELNAAVTDCHVIASDESETRCRAWTSTGLRIDYTITPDRNWIGVSRTDTATVTAVTEADLVLPGDGSRRSPAPTIEAAERLGGEGATAYQTSGDTIRVTSADGSQRDYRVTHAFFGPVGEEDQMDQDVWLYYPV